MKNLGYKVVGTASNYLDKAAEIHVGIDWTDDGNQINLFSKEGKFLGSFDYDEDGKTGTGYIHP